MERASSAPCDEQLLARLAGRGITPTPQRLEVARALFGRCEHLSAEEVHASVNADGRHVSRATVYNTLGLFVSRGLVREVIVDPARVFYDPNTDPHHHFFDADAGRLIDIDGDNVAVTGLPPLPEGTELDGIDVIVRLRHSR